MPDKHTPPDPWAVALHNGQNFVRVSSLLTFVSGLLLAWLPLIRHFHHQHFAQYFLPVGARAFADITSVLAGVLLMGLAYELLLRKRTAWYIAMGTCLASIIAEIALRQRVGPPVIFASLLLGLLIVGNKQFVARTMAVNIRRGLIAFGTSIAISLGYGTLGFWLLDKRDYGVTFSIGESLIRTIRQYLMIDNDDLTAHTYFGHFFLSSLRVVGLATIIYCIYSLLRPLRYELQTLPAERAHAKYLLQTYGGGTDDYFKLWPEDKSYFFSQDGEAFIAYAVSRGVAIAVANPEGKSTSLPGLLDDFTKFCIENGWLVAFVNASNKYKPLFEAHGYQSMTVGADAVIDLDAFITTTVRNKYFRNINNRFTKAGFTIERSTPPHSQKLIDEVEAISHDWLQLPNHHEWHFLAGSFSRAYVSQTPLVVLRNEIGEAVAFVNELPSFKPGEATIDLMRYRRDTPSNTMDFLFMSLFKQLHEDGFKQFNLGLSPLAGQQFADKAQEKLLNQIYLVSRRIVSATGLDRYKSKFDPQWQPRYTYYVGGTPTMPHIALALSRLVR